MWVVASLDGERFVVSIADLEPLPGIHDRYREAVIDTGPPMVFESISAAQAVRRILPSNEDAASWVVVELP